MSESAKFVQIAVTTEQANLVDSVYALDADGTVWVFDAGKRSWEEMPALRHSPRSK